MIYEADREPGTDHDHPQSDTTPAADGDASAPVDHDAGPGADAEVGEPGNTTDARHAASATAELPGDAVMTQDEWPDAPDQDTPDPDPDQPAPAAAPAPAPAPAPADHLEPIWTDDQTAQFQERWQDLQLRFVDDPRSAAEQAAALVGEAMDEFSTAVATRRQQLDAWRDFSGDNGEATEQMRIAVQNYHHLLDRLLAS